jgi:hypothetical protein
MGNIKRITLFSAVSILINCAPLKFVFSSADIYDPLVKIKTIDKCYIPIDLEYFTKSFLDSLTPEQLISIDSSISPKTVVPGICLIKSEESNPSCKDIRKDNLKVFKISGNDTIGILFNVTKYLRNPQEGWGNQKNRGDIVISSNSSSNDDIGPVCSFSKVLKLSIYEKPADTFYITLETVVPTSGEPDSYKYLWRVILGKQL